MFNIDDAQAKWELVNWDTFYQMARQLAYMIRDDGFKPDIIIAIARGGYTPARILSDFLGVMDMTSFKVKHYQSTHKEPVAVIEHPLAADVSGQRILLVDDVSDTGDTFDIAVEHINQCAKPRQIKTAVLHHKIVSRFVPDYYTKEVREWHWITYPWAVIEDVSAFIQKMHNHENDVKRIAEQIQREYGLSIAENIIKDALDFGF